MSIIGLPVGLYGYLFPGNINIMVLNLYASKQWRPLAAVLLLIVLFESAYCLGTLLLLGDLTAHTQLYRSIQVGSFVMIIAMGIWMLLEHRKKNAVVEKNTLYRGIFSTIVHPQQIPFWLIVGVVINPLVKFGADVASLAGFVLFNAAGTLLAMAVYMVFGQQVMRYFNLNLAAINRLLGFGYVGFGAYSFIRFIWFV